MDLKCWHGQTDNLHHKKEKRKKKMTMYDAEKKEEMNFKFSIQGLYICACINWFQIPTLNSNMNIMHRIYYFILFTIKAPECVYHQDKTLQFWNGVDYFVWWINLNIL